MNRETMTHDEILNMPAGREMDKLIVEQVMKWQQIDKGINYRASMGLRWAYQDDGVWKFQPGLVWLWSPSRDIGAAWEVVEWLRKNGYSFEMTEHADPQGDYIFQVWRRSMEPSDFICRADTAPLAICRAALLAVMEDRK